MFKGSHRERVQLAIAPPIGRKLKRVIGWLYITFPNQSEDFRQCVFDSGAELTVIPHHVWSVFVNPVEYEELADAPPIVGVGGSKCEVKYMHVGLALGGPKFDVFELGKCKVLLARDDKAAMRLPNILLGVGGGVLEKGGLCINWKENLACFIEVDDANPEKLGDR
ncbi:MAG: hypothetical protein JNL67_21760 [Planctomycetaceae bacterium]|nr:hypothetical protein [Planctomycetaceae bacterium]